MPDLLRAASENGTAAGFVLLPESICAPGPRVAKGKA